MMRWLILASAVSCAWAQLGLPLFQQPWLNFGQQPWGVAATTTTEEPTTTEDPDKPTTTNGYQALGWETDDDGNVSWGNDLAKIYLIQMPAEKYWAPIPKDWPEGPLFGSQWPDSPNYRPLPPGYVIPGGIKTNIPVLIAPSGDHAPMGK